MPSLDKVLKWMMRSKAHTVVKAPPDLVFGYLADFTRHPEWRRGETLLEVKKTSQGPVGIGSTFETLVRHPATMSTAGGSSPAWTERANVKVTDFAANERLAWENGANRFIVEVQEVPSGAGVALTEEWLGGRPLWENLLGLVLVWLWPIIWVGSQRSRHGELRRIKERVESGPASWTAGHPLGVGVQHYERGLDLGDEAKWREAVWEFDRAIDLNPKHANAYAQRGFAYAELGDSQRAVADMEKATSLTRDPNIIAGLKAAIDKLRGDG